LRYYNNAKLLTHCTNFRILNFRLNLAGLSRKNPNS
jgi:hypothetical protein